MFDRLEGSSADARVHEARALAEGLDPGSRGCLLFLLRFVLRRDVPQTQRLKDLHDDGGADSS